MMNNRINRYIIGITGASGAIIAKTLIELLVDMPFDKELYVTATENGLKVFEYETGKNLINFINLFESGNIKYYNNNDLFAPIASGSFSTDAMFIVPCSMATLGKIAYCAGSGLICRAADVCLKEKVRLVISPRETPFNSIHLRNMLSLSENGVVIAPPVLSFYSDDIYSKDDIVKNMAGRILKAGGIENNYYAEWKGNLT